MHVHVYGDIAACSLSGRIVFWTSYVYTAYQNVFCGVKLVVHFPTMSWTQVLLCLFPGVLWPWHFLYSVGPHPVSSLHIYTWVVSRAFMAGAASQAGDADSSRAPGLASGLQGSVNVHRGALLLVPQWQCISSFVFYIVGLLHHPFWFQLVLARLGHLFSNFENTFFAKDHWWGFSTRHAHMVHIVNQILFEMVYTS